MCRPWNHLNKSTRNCSSFYFQMPHYNIFFAIGLFKICKVDAGLYSEEKKYVHSKQPRSYLTPTTLEQA